MLARIGIMRALAKSGSNACATLRWSHESLKRINVSQIFIKKIKDQLWGTVQLPSPGVDDVRSTITIAGDKFPPRH